MCGAKQSVRHVRFCLRLIILGVRQNGLSQGYQSHCTGIEREERENGGDGEGRVQFERRGVHETSNKQCGHSVAARRQGESMGIVYGSVCIAHSAPFVDTRRRKLKNRIQTARLCLLPQWNGQRSADTQRDEEDG